MKAFFTRISIFGDILKDFLITLLVIVLILVATLGIGHNILKINEVSSKYTGVYKNLVKIGTDRMINVYSIGGGQNTIVILSRFGSESPVLEYKALANELSKNNRVVIVEYLGYGFSLAAKTDRTSGNIVREVREALINSEIYGPYVLLSQYTSSIYAMKYQELYPNEVSSIVSIDAVLPNMTKEEQYMNEIVAIKDNAQIEHILELTGYARILSYLKPELFNIDTMLASSTYTDSDISLYRHQIGISHLTSTMAKEAKLFCTNVEDEKEYVYPDYLKTLQIITSENFEKYEILKEDKKISKSYGDYSLELLTNGNIQRVQTISGGSSIQLTNPNELAQVINSFLDQ
jgi:hypothetical protein